MFNEKRKLEFIQEAKKSNAALEKIYNLRFNVSAEIEQKLNKDLCEWNALEILDFYKMFVGRSLESLLVFHSQYKRYADWCLTNMFIPDSQNHFAEIDREVLQKECINVAYLDMGIVTREELLKLLKEYHMEIQNAYEIFLILAIFEGIDGSKFQDLRNLTMDNFKGNTVYLPTRTLTVSDRLVAIAEESSETYQYYSTAKSIRDWDFNPSDRRIIKLKKGTREVDDAAYNHKLSMNLARIADRCESPTFSRAMLHESGRIDYINNIIMKEHIDAYTAIKTHREELSLRYGKIQTVIRYTDKWDRYLLKP